MHRRRIVSSLSCCSEDVLRHGELTSRGNSPRNRWFESVSLQRQSPECAYDIVFFDEFARAAGWTERLSLENPELRRPS